VCLFAVFATSAFAYTGYWVPCGQCHGTAPGAITVTPTAVSNDGTDAVYSFSAPGATEWVLYAGYTKLYSGSGATTGNLTLPAGIGYEFFAVSGSPTAGSFGSALVSPAADPFPDPTGDITAPVSTSDAVAAYNGPATIRIDATDAQSGVAFIYFTVNGGGSVRTTPVGTSGYALAYIKPTGVGTTDYTLQFWSQDRAGNIEAENEVAFSVTLDGWTSTATPSTITGPSGMSPWTYQDASDSSPKREGGYAAYGGVSGYYTNPHGGYDTSTNK
jgi:hypothetical protein